MAMQNEVVVGIDLGTTYSCVAVYKDGKAKVLADPEEGNRIIPSCVFLGKKQEIGDIAKSKLILDPKNVVYESKRLIGRSFSDPEVQHDIKHWPFKVVDNDGKPKIYIQSQEKGYFPEEISAMVLKKMKGIAEYNLGTIISKAVITVPAHFNESQRQATKDAAKIAGLEVMRIINEPTAAALAYGMEKKKNGELHKIVVFDIGGGTFDVSVLQIDGGVYQVKSTGGDTHLGGSDFDMNLVEYVLAWFRKEHNIPESEEIVERPISRLRRACEQAKHNLSASENTKIHIDVFHKGIDLDFAECNLHDFEEINKGLFLKTVDILQQTLKDANLKPEDVDDIVLVGGSTRIPKIRQLVQDVFSQRPLNLSINPEEAIACGAAIQAAIISGNVQEDLEEMVLLDVASLSLGVELEGGIMYNMIERNSLIPCRYTHEVTTIENNQTVIPVAVYQGERELVRYNHYLGEFTLEGITPTLAGVPEIDVTFTLNSDGCLEVGAKERTTGKNQKMTIDYNKARCSSDEVEKILQETKNSEVKDKAEAERITARFALEQFAKRIQFLLQNHVEELKLSPSQTSVIMRHVEQVLNWINTAQKPDPEMCEQKMIYLKAACKDIHPEFMTPGVCGIERQISDFVWLPEDKDDNGVPEVD